MKLLLVPILLVSFVSSLSAQSYILKDRYGRNQQVIVHPRCITQYDRFGRVQNNYRIYGNRIYQFNQKGMRK